MFDWASDEEVQEIENKQKAFQDELYAVLDKFKNRELKAKDVFVISHIPKNEAYEFIRQYHYLGDAKFFSAYNVGIYTKGILPQLNGTNCTSYLLGNAMKVLKKEGIRLITTLADASRHNGAIYQVTNFKCYGLTDTKSDFIRYDGVVNPRGSTKDTEGFWLPRTRKYRYAYALDDKVKVLYKEQPFPTKEDLIQPECCKGTNIIFDNRFKKEYPCPKCSDKNFVLENGETDE